MDVSKDELLPPTLREEIKLERKRKTGSALAQRIFDAIISNSFIGCVVFGSQRIGKSAYALCILREIYGTWNKALDHCLFSIDDVLDLLRDSVEKRKRINAFIWDDAGIHCSKHLFFSDRKRAQYLQSLFDVIGFYLGAVILTTPTPSNLLKTIRDYEFYRVKITRKDNYWGRNALGYRNIMLPSGASYIKKIFQDSFSCKLPDSIYEKYCKMRRKYTKVAIEKLEEYLEK